MQTHDNGESFLFEIDLVNRREIILETALDLPALRSNARWYKSINMAGSHSYFARPFRVVVVARVG